MYNNWIIQPKTTFKVLTEEWTFKKNVTCGMAGIT